jgi:two-component system, NarL family, sensor histidine kinase UhpB
LNELIDIETYDGQQKTIQNSSAPIRNAEGLIVGAIFVNEDVTERAHAEKALRDYGRLIREMAAHLVEMDEAGRQKLSQELHDRIGQILTALSINLNIIRGQLSGDLHEKIAPRIDDSLSLVEEAVSRIRDVIADLRPPVLDDYGLVVTLRWYGKQFAYRTGIAVKIRGKEISPRTDPNVEAVLFRIAQEAFTNISKHANATKVVVIVTSDENSLCLSINDDGIGFHPSEGIGSGKQRGWGLITMSERAESLGGSFRIGSRSKHGTKVVVKVPR